jgi:hypothetical protein
MIIQKRSDGYWFKHEGQDYGPYATVKEAKDDEKGLRKFSKVHPETVTAGEPASDSEPAGPTADDDPKTAVKDEDKQQQRKNNKKKGTNTMKQQQQQGKKKPAAPVKQKAAEKKGQGAAADNPFAAKLDSKAGDKIEKMYLSGKSWKEMAAELGVTVSSVRFRFLDFLMKYVYESEEEDAG